METTLTFSFIKEKTQQRSCCLSILGHRSYFWSALYNAHIVVKLSNEHSECYCRMQADTVII